MVFDSAYQPEKTGKKPEKFSKFFLAEEVGKELHKGLNTSSQFLL